MTFVMLAGVMLAVDLAGVMLAADVRHRNEETQQPTGRKGFLVARGHRGGGSRNGVTSRDRKRRDELDQRIATGRGGVEDTRPRTSRSPVQGGRGRRGANITKLRNGPGYGYSSDVQIVQSREAVVIREELIHDARCAPPGPTNPSPAICSTAAW